MSLFENPSAAPVADAKTSTPETQPVAANEGATEPQVNNATSGKMYNGDQMQAVVKDRVARLEKKHLKEMEALKAQYEKPATVGKPTNIEEEFRSKIEAGFYG